MTKKDIISKTIQRADGALYGIAGAMAGAILPDALKEFLPYTLPLPKPLDDLSVTSGLTLAGIGIIGGILAKKESGKFVFYSMGGAALAVSIWKLYKFYSQPAARYRSSTSAPYVRTPSRTQSIGTCASPLPSSSITRGRLNSQGGSMRPGMISAGSTQYPLQRTSMDNQPNNLQHVVVTTQGPKIIYA